MTQQWDPVNHQVRVIKAQQIRNGHLRVLEKLTTK